MEQPLNILVIEDCLTDFLLLERQLRHQGMSVQCVRVDRMADLEDALAKGGWDLILSDYKVPSLDFYDSFARIQTLAPELPVILVSGNIGEERAVELLKLGIRDYVLKDSLIQLEPAIRRTLAEEQGIRDRQLAERALRESEIRYRRLFEAAQDGILILEADTGQIVDANPFVLDLLSYSYSDCIGKKLWDIGLFADIEASKSAFRELQTKNYTRYENLPLATKSGLRREVEFISNSYQVGDRTVIQCHIRDITAHSQALALLRQERDFSEGLVETAQIIILVLNPQGQIVRFNHFTETLLGYALNEVAGQDWFDRFLPEPERMKMRQVFIGAVNNLQTRGNVNAILTKDGRQLLIEWYDKTLKDEQGKTIGLLCIGLDVTERLRSQQEILNSKNLLQSIVETAPVRIFWKDTELRYLGCNAQFARDAGHSSSDEVTGKTDFEMGWKDQAALYRADDKDVIESGSPKLAFEEPQTTPDGNRIWLRTSKVPLRDAGQRVIGILGIYDDITESKLAEEKLHRVNRALRTLSASNLALVQSTQEQELLRKVVQVIAEIGGYPLAVVCYAEDDSLQSIRPIAWSDFDGSPYWVEHLSWGENAYGSLPIARAIQSGVTQVCNDIASDPAFRLWREAAHARGYVSNIGLPLSDGSRIFGGLSIYSSEANAFDEEEVQLLGELADDLAYGIVSLRTRKSHEQYVLMLRQSLEQSIQTIAGTVESRDPYTAGHQRRVADLATAIAREIGLPPDQITGIHLAGIIHDLGNIHIPAEILTRTGKVSALEYQLIQTHPQAGYDILKDVKFPWPITDIILQHHERLDGSGYPQGLKGEEILLESKIIAVADVVEAISSHRTYRPSLGIEAALKEIERHRGVLFDATAVDACIKLFRELGYQLPP